MTPPTSPPPSGMNVPPPPGPYPPPGYPPPYAPPPKKDNLVLIVIVVLVVVVVIGAAIAAWFFLLLSPTIPQPSRPFVILATASVSGGSATITVGAAYPEEPPADFKVSLMANGTDGSAGMAASGSPASVTLNSATFGITWRDVDGRGTLSTGDTFTIATPSGLPSSTSFIFSLVWASDGTILATRTFTT